MIGSVPMRRYDRIEVIAGTVAFLLGDGASCITGVDVPIAGRLP